MNTRIIYRFILDLSYYDISISIGRMLNLLESNVIVRCCDLDSNRWTCSSICYSTISCSGTNLSTISMLIHDEYLLALVYNQLHTIRSVAHDYCVQCS
jgi:hypothetical protein